MPEAKAGVVPELRFPKFRDAGPWEVKRLGELINTVAPPKKLQTTEYLPGGQFPIIDQSPSEVCGWTDDETALVEADFPLVIFGDHTCVVKLAEGPFAQGADGIKILAPSSEIEARFLFLSLQADPIEQKGYKRHFSTLKEKLIPFPRKDTGEQQKIVDCLGSLDDLIRAEEGRLAALRAHKTGLMQRLFPAPGQTTPRLRFPEFLNAGPWEVKRLGELFEERTERGGKRDQLLSVTMGSGVVRASDLDRRTNASSDLSNYKQVLPGDIVYNSMRMWQGASGVSIDSGLVSPAYTVVIPGEEQVSGFWGYYFKHPSSLEKFTQYSQGVTSDTWNLKFPAFSTIKMLAPRLVSEQQRIADCLTSLDDLIRAQGERIEALKAHKKGLMQKLFPREVG